MSSNTRASEDEIPQNTFFHQQRALLVSEIAQSLDSVLKNLNSLNRSLEATIAVGNEFSNVEALWSTFEGVMGDQSTDNNPEVKEGEASEGAANTRAEEK